MIEGIGGRLPLNPLRASPRADAPSPVKAGPPGDIRTAGAAAIKRDLAASPPIDTAKVDRVRTAIAAGAYPIEPTRIAAAMIATDLKRG